MKNKDFNTIVIGLQMIEKHKQEYKEAERAIMANDVWSQEYKEAQAEKARTLAAGKIAEIHSKIDTAAEALEAYVKQNAPKLDITDGRIQTAIMLAQTVGEDMPYDTQESLIAPFLGNAQTLGVLLPVLKGAGVMVAAQAAESELERLGQSTNFLSNACDTAYYAQDMNSAPAELHNVLTGARVFAEVHGFDVPEMTAEAAAEIA